MQDFNYIVAAALQIQTKVGLGDDPHFFCLLGSSSSLLLRSGHTLLQILIFLSSSMGYWQLFFLAASVAMMPLAPNLVFMELPHRG